ncbi:hypothetical protein C5167_025716 [Papaver somniferum]|uniref:CMP/dCMP-type deaminase domain-containing protein n=1 Tax=Papaver somniferum TaxID=3469 RepID=A0A4Y7JTR5_PAPSO|nr:tRNA-specific adenosine deaminase TAD3-like [Papaver somniferum]RZC63946.1 hypothetical protein C5167_025716 [Papaver somniferum]
MGFKKGEILHIPDKIPLKPNEQPTIDVFASVIEPKLTNTLVKKLGKIAPMENYRHIKRVWKKKKKSVGEGEGEGGGDFQLVLILCIAGENGGNELLPDDVAELVNAHQLSPFIAKVHKYAAITKEEWIEQCKLWPTSYHPPTYNIEGITGFNEEDSESVFHFMKMALEMTVVGGQGVVNAAVIVDPSIRQVIASANDQTCQAISASTVNAGVSCLYPWNWTEQDTAAAGNIDCSWHPLRHAALVAIEQASSRDKRLYPAGLEDFEDQATDQVDCTMSKRQKVDFVKDEKVLKAACSNGGSFEGGERPYLCTGYDIFVAWEPCTMCAMALVHQRIRRIFYAFPNPNCGALGSVYRLQGEKSLNHHYAVFRVLLPEEESSKA